jgi:hypothetical protein
MLLANMSRRLLNALQAIEYILPEQQIAIVKELEPHVLKCVKDANGNHVGLTLYSGTSYSPFIGRTKTHRACTGRASQFYSSFQGQRFRTFNPSLRLSRSPKMLRALRRGTD